MDTKATKSGTIHCARCNSTEIHLNAYTVPVKGTFGKSQIVYDKLAFCFNCNKDVEWVNVPVKITN